MFLGEEYRFRLPAVLPRTGTRPLTYSIVESLPAGLTFDPDTLDLEGPATTLAIWRAYTLKVIDSARPRLSDTLSFNLEVINRPRPGLPRFDRALQQPSSRLLQLFFDYPENVAESLANGMEANWRLDGETTWRSAILGTQTTPDGRHQVVMIIFNYTDGTRYDYRIRAKTTLINPLRITRGDYLIDSYTTSAAPPHTPTAFTASTGSPQQPGAVDFAWTPATTGGPVTTWRIQYKFGSGSWTNLTTVKGNFTSTSWTMDTPNRLYSFRIRGENVGGNTAWVETTATSSQTYPADVQGPWYLLSASSPATPTTNTTGVRPTGYLFFEPDPDATRSVWRTYARRDEGQPNYVYDQPEEIAVPLNDTATYYRLGSSKPAKPANDLVPLSRPTGWGLADVIPSPTTTQDVWKTTATRAPGSSTYTFSDPVIHLNRLPPPSAQPPTGFELVRQLSSGSSIRFLFDWVDPTTGPVISFSNYQLDVWNGRSWAVGTVFTRRTNDARGQIYIRRSTLTANLRNTQQLFARVRSVSAGTPSAWAQITFYYNQPTNVIPNQILSISSPEQTETTADIAWTPDNAGGRPTDYDLEYKVGTAGQWINHPFTGAATRTTLTGLVANTEYSVRIRANNQAGNGPWKTADNLFTTEATGTGGPTPGPGPQPGDMPLATPVITEIADTLNSVSFSWTAVAGAARYEVHWNGQGTWITTNLSVSQAARTGIVSGLAPGQSIQVRVRAIPSDSTRRASEAVKTIDSESSSAGPTTLDAPDCEQTTETFSSATMGWDRVDNATSYSVERLGPGGWAAYHNWRPDSLTATVTGLSVGGSARLRVRARSSSTAYRDSPWTEFTVTARDQVYPPTNLREDQVVSNQARLRWNRPSDATGLNQFRLEWKLSNQIWSQAEQRTLSALTTLYTITGLSAGSTYDWRIKATGSAGYTDSGYVSGSFTT